MPVPILDCYSQQIATTSVCISASMLKSSDRSQEVQTQVLLVPDDISHNRFAKGLLNRPAFRSPFQEWWQTCRVVSSSKYHAGKSRDKASRFCMQLSSGKCPTYGIIVGNQAHPEGFCQRTCNRCGDYCIRKNGGSIPAGSRSTSRSSSTPSGRNPPASSGTCSDNPPSSQYSCAQQVWYCTYMICV